MFSITTIDGCTRHITKSRGCSEILTLLILGILTFPQTIIFLFIYLVSSISALYKKKHRNEMLFGSLK